MIHGAFAIPTAPKGNLAPLSVVSPIVHESPGLAEARASRLN